MVERTEGGGERLLRDGAALDEHFEHGHVRLERRRRRGGGGGAEEERCEHLGQLRHRPLESIGRERGVDEANAVAVRALVVGDGVVVAGRRELERQQPREQLRQRRLEQRAAAARRAEDCRCLAQLRRAPLAGLVRRERRRRRRRRPQREPQRRVCEQHRDGVVGGGGGGRRRRGDEEAGGERAEREAEAEP